MTRGNDKGKDFDDQYHSSRRRGQERARKGEGPYAADKYLERINHPRPSHRASEDKSCGKATLFLLGMAAGAGWLADQAVRYVA